MKQYHLKCWPAKDLGAGGRDGGRPSLLWPDTWSPASEQQVTGQQARLRVHCMASQDGAWGCQPGAPVHLGFTVVIVKQDASRLKSSAGEQEGFGSAAYNPSREGGPDGAKGNAHAGPSRALSGRLQAVPYGGEELQTTPRRRDSRRRVFRIETMTPFHPGFVCTACETRGKQATPKALFCHL